MDNLCFDCGLCCNGTLFDKVDIPGEDDLLLPCVNLTSTNRCAIYENRPKPCQDYVCIMLHNYTVGKMTKENALRLIDDVKSGVVTKQEFKRVDNNKIIGNYL